MGGDGGHGWERWVRWVGEMGEMGGDAWGDKNSQMKSKLLSTHNMLGMLT